MKETLSSYKQESDNSRFSFEKVKKGALNSVNQMGQHPIHDSHLIALFNGCFQCTFAHLDKVYAMLDYFSFI